MTRCLKTCEKTCGRFSHVESSLWEARVFASNDGEERVFHNTCKSRACPSCGNWATLQWLNERQCSLPDINYLGLVLTMPRGFSEVFRMNPNLQADVPALGAAALKHWAWSRYGSRVYIVVVPHSFGGALNFHLHLHILVSTDGYSSAERCWIHDIKYDHRRIMELWRDVVTSYLQMALRSNLLKYGR